MSKQPLVDYYIKMKISNLSGKKVLLIPGDNDPASGMPINANVIAMISKDVPVVEPNVPAVQFAVVDAASRRQFLLINGSQLITLRPVKNKNVVPINLVIGNPSESTNCWGTLPFNFWSAPAMWKRTKKCSLPIPICICKCSLPVIAPPFHLLCSKSIFSTTVCQLNFCY